MKTKLEKRKTSTWIIDLNLVLIIILNVNQTNITIKKAKIYRLDLYFKKQDPTIMLSYFTENK